MLRTVLWTRCWLKGLVGFENKLFCLTLVVRAEHEFSHAVLYCVVNAHCCKGTVSVVSSSPAFASGVSRGKEHHQ